MVAKVKFKFIGPNSHWYKMPMSGIKHVGDMKEAIIARMSQRLDGYPASQLAIQASKAEYDCQCDLVLLGNRESVGSIMRRFGIKERSENWQEVFAKSIWLFVSVGIGNQSQAQDEELVELLGLKVRKFKLSDFDFEDFLGSGRSADVFRSTYRGKAVAVKQCDLWLNPECEKELINEARIYACLKELQGRVIPKFKAIGYRGGRFLLVMDIAGTPVDQVELRNQERKKVVEALSEIHHHGILHNDVRPGNILVRWHDADGFEVRFIDFASSQKISDRMGPRREMATLRCILGLPPIPRVKNSRSMGPSQTSRLSRISEEGE